MPTATGKYDPLNEIKIIGEGFDELGQRYFKLRVQGSDRDLPPYSVAGIVKPEKLYSDLGNAGCNLFTRQAQRALLELLQNHERKELNFSVVTRLGAFPTFYVQPNEIIGSPTLPVELATGTLDAQMLQKFRCRGSLVDWQRKIGRLCAGNSRLMFAASLACTGPVLSLVKGPRSGGFQISGRAESGKTAAAMVAGSIWGCHADTTLKEKGFAESWNTTVNKLEETARAHSDSLLILDETNLAGSNARQRAEAIVTGSFRLSEATKKGRYTEAETAGWRLYFLSTSNLTLAELAEQGGVPIDDQHRARLVDITLPKKPGGHGIYEDLHGFNDGAKLTDTVKARCRSFFGTPGYELVCRLYANAESRKAARRFLKARRDFYIARLHIKAGACGFKPLERATARFATVYAAGCLAIEYGIFSWSRKDLLRAISSCQSDGLVLAAEKIDPATDLQRKLTDYLAEHRGDFVSLDGKKLSTKKHQLGSAPGYAHAHRGEPWFYLTSDQLKTIIGTGRAAKQVKRQLIKEGLIDSTGDRALVQRPIFRGRENTGYRWVHAFRASLLDSSMETPRRRALNKNR
jgi:hypothetical protein